MAFRRTAVLAGCLALSSVAPALAAEPVEPRAGATLVGTIDFPRAQRMTIRTDATEGSRLIVNLGFNGRCRGGGLGELYASNVRATPDVRVRDGRFAATLTGTIRNLGEGRTAALRWRLSGRFVQRDVAVATVSGSGEVRLDGKTVSRCKIAAPADVRLTAR